VRLTHAGFAVADLDAAVEFYRRAFGYEVAFEDRGMTDLIRHVTGLPGLRCDLAQLRRPGSDGLLELIAFRDVPYRGSHRAPVRPGQGHVGFEVDNLDEVIGRLQALGASLVGDVTLFPEGRSVYLREPSGTVVELDEPGQGG
jgi:catechol 2,3-dioxygenase-like lactoylglutathione lyase family enzyme